MINDEHEAIEGGSRMVGLALSVSAHTEPSPDFPGVLDLYVMAGRCCVTLGDVSPYVTATINRAGEKYPIVMIRPEAAVAIAAVCRALLAALEALEDTPA